MVGGTGTDLDMNSAVSPGNLNVNISSPEDPLVRTARLEREKEDAVLRRYKERGVFNLSALGLIATFGVAVGMLVSGNPEQMKLGQTLITSILSGLLGFLAGKGK